MKYEHLHMFSLADVADSFYEVIILHLLPSTSIARATVTTFITSSSPPNYFTSAGPPATLFGKIPLLSMNSSRWSGISPMRELAKSKTDTPGLVNSR